jgi:hypothetical protein
VGQLVGGGGNLWFDEIEHAREQYSNLTPKESRIISRPADERP